ncbi:polyphosphate polymerase domain-containing protein, partial [Streptomyces hainanensis]
MTADARHERGVASRLHAFNRYEIKYLVPVTEVAPLRDELARRMEPDTNCPVGGYGVWSVYYDTPALRFYWEKIEGLKFRRKLRIRHYGDVSAVTDDSPVHVEIKQRVNRVTQKRRLRLPYHAARALCDGRVEVEHAERERPFVHEVLDLLIRLDLRATAMTGYRREALVGREQDTGLRVTFDRRIRGRDRDFHFASPAENRYIVPPRLAVMEVKVNERVPYWITDLMARRNLTVVRVSKYCQSVEAYGRAPRSAFHVPDEAEAPATSAPTPPTHQFET